MKATHLYCVGCLHHCRTKNDVRAFMRTGNCVRCTRIFKKTGEWRCTYNPPATLDENGRCTTLPGGRDNPFTQEP